jgi:hypothetical protein
VDVASQFTVNSGGGTSAVWGPFSLATSLSAVFDMQAVGSSNGAVIMQYSKDNKATWEQVGAQAKNGSTSYVTGKLIDLSAETVPWGPAIYIRFLNSTSNNVNIKNLKITASVYTINGIDSLPDESQILKREYYNLKGQQVTTDFKGIVIEKIFSSDNRLYLRKILKSIDYQYDK